MAKKKRNAALTPEEQQEAKYQKAVRRMEGAEKMLQAGDGMHMYKEAIRLFESLGDYRESKEYKKKCEQELPRKRKEFREEVYHAGMNLKKKAVTAADYETAIEEFERLKVTYKDIPEQIAECRQLQSQALKKEGQKRLLGRALLVCAIVALAVLAGYLRSPAAFYQEGKLLMSLGDYDHAGNLFAHSRNYKDTEERLTECNYQRAMACAREGDYSRAVRLLQKRVGDYKDALKQKAAFEQKIFSEAAKGDVVPFGPRQWLVTDINGNQMLLVQKNARKEGVAYESSGEAVTWEDSDLRNWLNSVFYPKYFSAYEQEMIVKTQHDTSQNSTYATDGGSGASDWIFLLDEQEAHSYMSMLKEQKNQLEWWLRTPGKTQESAEYVSGDGTIRAYGYTVDAEDMAVRPAIWILVPDR